MYARLKCCDHEFSANPQYIFHALEWIEQNAVGSSANFAERKQFQSKINVGQLVNHDIVRGMISDDQIFCSYKNRGTPQYFHSMDVFARTRQFELYTFFLNCSTDEFDWSEVIQFGAHQYG